MHAPLVLEAAYRLVHLAARELFDDLLQGRIVLSDDRVEMDGLHAGLLELLIRPSGLDGLMLADVADEQHAILRAETVQEVVHLSVLARLDSSTTYRCFCRSSGGSRSCEMSLQRARGDPGLCQFLRRA